MERITNFKDINNDKFDISKLKLASKLLLEQETVLCAVRGEWGLLNCYSSDNRVILKALKHYLADMEEIRYNKNGEVTSITFKIDIRIFRKTVLMPLYYGEKTN